MLRISFLLATTAALASFSTVATAQDKLSLDVYYESLCPDSLKFLVSQLGPQYDTISTFVDVRLVPFGKARFQARKDAGYTFDCQHGPRECRGNIIHACGIEYSTSESQAVQFAKCLMQSPNESERCANSVDLDYATVESCAGGLEGQLLLQLHGVETLSLKPRLTFVPWLVFNKEWSQENQDAGLKDLKATACNLAPQNTAVCQ